ncbi:MAG: hypothetical protein MUO82_08040 [Candidatus Thermoplasmatota archaeon]|nr:hypothetical protein [Candidatus Thermoplasmatota archaeon]
MADEVFLVVAGAALILLIVLLINRRYKNRQYKNLLIEKKKSRKKVLFSIMVMVILVTLVLSIGSYYIMDKNLFTLKQEIKNINNNLNITFNSINYSNSELSKLEVTKEKYQNYLEQNNTELQLLLQGDEYKLHNPLYSEAVKFMAEDKNINDSLVLDNAKSNGIRCAYAEARTPDGSHCLIAFDTIDKGMIYFEPNTGYLVNPLIGKSYVDCVSGSPYYNITDDTISQILVYW